MPCEPGAEALQAALTCCQLFSALLCVLPAVSFAFFDRFAAFTAFVWRPLSNSERVVSIFITAFFSLFSVYVILGPFTLVLQNILRLLMHKVREFKKTKSVAGWNHGAALLTYKPAMLSKVIQRR